MWGSRGQAQPQGDAQPMAARSLLALTFASDLLCWCSSDLAGFSQLPVSLDAFPA